MIGSTHAGSGTQGDQSLRFLFEGADIRGERVQLGQSYREILSIHQYSSGVSRLLGEFLAASVLLSSNLKFEGKLVLQARSQGQVPLLMAECDHELHIRGIARGVEHATARDNESLLNNGQLVITVDPTHGQRYQGITALHGHSLAHSLDSYFEQSEQLKSRLWLAADGENAGGLLLQQLPPHITRDESVRVEQWEHACSMTADLSTAELLNPVPDALLRRIYHRDTIRLFEPSEIRFRCNCSRQRTLRALCTLDPAELEELLTESACITMDCEFCNQQYSFDREDLSSVLQATGTKTLH